MSVNTANKRIAKNTIFLYVRMIFVLLVSLYTTRVVLNTLGVSDYGIYNVVAGFVSMFAFLNSAMNNTTQRFMNFEKGAGNKESLNDVFVTSCQIQILICFVSFTILEIFGIWYINNVMVLPVERMIAANWVFQFSVLSLILLILQMPFSAAIISHEKLDYFAIVSIIDVMLKLIVVVLLPYVSYDKLIFYGIISMLISFLNFIMYYMYARRNFEEIRFKLTYNKKLFKVMLSFSGWNMFGALAYTLQGQGLNVLINSFFGTVVNAARGIAYQVHGAIAGFSENIAISFRPQLVESYAKEEYDRTLQLMYVMSKSCYFMIFLMSLPILIDLQNILNLWLDGTVPEFSIMFTTLVLVNLLITSLNLPVSQTVQATGKVKWYQILRSILVASTLPISWIFLKIGFESTIVFWITLVISIANHPLSMYILHRYFKYSYMEYISKVILPCLKLTIFAPMVPLIIHFYIDESVLSFIIVGFTSVLCTVSIAFYVLIDHNDRNKLIGFFVKNISHK